MTTTPENTPNDMPYFWDMRMIKLFNQRTGHLFFAPKNMRFFSSRIQTTPPYSGRVFVTSERMRWNNTRLYAVRCIQPDGGIDTIESFGAFASRQSAHRFAKAYAAQRFARVGNKSVELPAETKMA